MTSIEWLIDQMFKQGYFDGNKPLSFTNLDHLQQQAKEMHKKEIITSYAFGHNDGCRYMNNDKQEFEHGEGYYQETFKKD